MEGINILATKMVLDYGVCSLWWLIVGVIGICIGYIALINASDWGVVPTAIGGLIVIIVIVWIFTPVKAHIATIDDNVPYKYIEEHYRIIDKNDNLYTLIPKEETK